MLAFIRLGKTGGSLADLAWNTFVPPCSVMGKRLVESLEAGPQNTTAVRIKGIKSPLYFPNEFGLIGLYHVLTEAMYSRNWHFYTPSETPLEKGDIVFDCGSAEGLFMLLAKNAGATGVVFEPHPTYLRGLRLTFANDETTKIVDSALSSQSSTALLLESSYGSRIVSEEDDGPHIRINIETLDAAAQRMECTPTFIKADIEGYEEKMLEGAAEIISSAHPKLAITTYHHENNVDSIRNLLRRYHPNYRFRIKGISNRNGKSVMLHAWS
ncbi:FkbM family methyltransferase [Acidobacteria bacterium AB60]|nr:FkbM family methyltransferase [Acidobacteria bacterium AB60]